MIGPVAPVTAHCRGSASLQEVVAGALITTFRLLLTSEYVAVAVQMASVIVHMYVPDDVAVMV